MRLYLLRHFESEKNQKETLSSNADDDSLTAAGKAACQAFAAKLRGQLARDNHSLRTILASSSSRGLQTAQIVAKELHNTQLRPCDFLRSTRAGPYAGMAASAIKALNPGWHHAFELFQAGILNQYAFDRPPLAIGAEPKHEFEGRVVGGLLQTLRELTDDAALVVASRSSLNAIHIYFARKYYGYPLDYFGYIRMDLGAVSIVDEQTDGGWRFIKVNSVDPTT